MESLIICSLRAIRSLLAPGMFGVFIKSLLLTLLALFLFVSAVSGLFIWLASFSHNAFLHAFLPVMGFLGSHLLAWFLFPGIMPIIVSFFDERIAAIIEKDDYPTAQPLRKAEFWPEFLHDLRFTLLVIFLNILILPLYLLFHVFSPVLFYLLNGYLLGREFFVMVAKRHVPVAQAERLRVDNRGTVLLIGMALTVMATIPLVNLVAPFWGIAAMVHFYHRLPGAQIMETPGQPRILF